MSECLITVQLASVQRPIARNVADEKLAYKIMQEYSSLDTKLDRIYPLNVV